MIPARLWKSWMQFVFLFPRVETLTCNGRNTPGSATVHSGAVPEHSISFHSHWLPRLWFSTCPVCSPHCLGHTQFTPLCILTSSLLSYLNAVLFIVVKKRKHPQSKVIAERENLNGFVIPTVTFSACLSLKLAQGDIAGGFSRFLFKTAFKVRIFRVGRDPKG